MPERTTVSIARCDSYDRKAVKEAVSETLARLGGLSIYIAPKDKVLIKPNLVRGAKPESISQIQSGAAMPAHRIHYRAPWHAKRRCCLGIDG